MKGAFSAIILVFTSCITLATANPCAGLWWGQYVPHHEVCFKYYTCILTVANERTCREGNVFDPSQSQCVPGNQETCEIYGQATTTIYESTTLPPPVTTEAITTEEATTTIETTTTEASTTTTEEDTTTTTTEATTPEPQPNLDEICQGVFFAARPFPNSNSLYVGCIRSSGVLFQCFDDEIFHPVIHECVSDRTSVPTETSTSTQTYESTWESSTEQSTSTSQGIVTTQAPNLDELCKGKYFEYIEHPTNCALSVFCYEQMYFVRQCPEYQIFDIKIKSCRYGDQITCEFVGENTATIPSSTDLPETSSVVSSPCQGVSNGLRPHEYDCTRFYRCVMGRSVISTCSSGEIFDQAKSICVSGDQETCTIT